MHPIFWNVPGINYPLRTYGVLVLVGFVAGIWLAVRRAKATRMNPDTVLNGSFLAFIGGFIGCRLFYVIHYWDAQFAHQPHPWWAALDFTSGGMELYGGVILATAMIAGYLLLKRQSIRMYFDLGAPVLMLGLAFGRLACFFQGCCYGSLCETPASYEQHPDDVPLYAVQFPYGTDAFARQWSERQLTVPAELIYIDAAHAELLPSSLVFATPEQLYSHERKLEDLRSEHEAAVADEAPRARTDSLEKQVEIAEGHALRMNEALKPLFHNLQLESPDIPGKTMTPGELSEMAKRFRALPVYATQIFSSVNAFLLFFLLSAVWKRRKRHGVVAGLFLVLYPITRVILEQIRTDNLADTFGLTISQAVSLGVAAFGAVWLIVIYRMPLRSSRAIPYVPPAPAEPQPA